MPSFPALPLFCFLCVRLYVFIEVATIRSIALRYAGAWIATRVSLFSPFVSLETSLFPKTICTIAIFSLYGEYVVYFFLPDNVFLPFDHGLGF